MGRGVILDGVSMGKMGREERKKEKGKVGKERRKLGVVEGKRWPLCLGKGCLGRGELSVVCGREGTGKLGAGSLGGMQEERGGRTGEL